MIVKEVLESVSPSEIMSRILELYEEEDPRYLLTLDRLLNKEPVIKAHPSTLIISDEGYDAYYINKEEGTTYSITLTPEEEVLGMEVLTEDPVTTAAHIMYVLCFDGFEVSDKDDLKETIMKAIAQVENKEDDMFVSFGNIKMHRQALDSLGDDVDIPELLEGFKEELRKSGQLPNGFDSK